MSITTFRQAVAQQLQTALQFDFVDGYLEGPQRRNLGCTWPDSRAENEEERDYEWLTIFVRLFEAMNEAVLNDPETPIDPAQLESWSETILTSLDDVQVGIGGVWYMRVPETEFDLPRQTLTATVQGRQANPYRSTS